MRRRAFTLVEVLVAFGLVCSISALVYTNFAGGWRQSERLSFRLQALQAAYLVRSRMAADLSSYIPGPAGMEPVRNAPSLGFLMVTPEDNAGIEGTSLDEDLKPITIPVSYEFDPADHRLYRNGKPLGTMRFAKVAFFHEPYEPGLEKGETVGVDLVVVPEHLLATPDADESKRLAVRFTFHCPQTTLARVYDDCTVYTFH